MFRQRVRSIRFMVKEMHRFIIHAHQLCQAGRLLGSNIIGMELRTQGSETSILQIEVISAMIILQVGIQSEKTGKAHQEDQMEIGKPTAAFIQPDNGMMQISKQRTVLCLLPHAHDKGIPTETKRWQIYKDRRESWRKDKKTSPLSPYI